jgi:hypothetical protein
VVLTANIDYAKLTPRDALVVLHPTIALRSDWLSEFMVQGGRVAVIDDYGNAGEFFEKYDIRRLNAPLNPAECLRGNPNLAWAVPSGATMPDNSSGVRAHPIVDGLQRVLTNHPIVLSSSRLTPLLEIRSLGGETAVLAYAGVIGRRGRLLAMGDPSVFINLMMRYPENRLFAERLSAYLTSDDDWGRRAGLLYLVSNKFTESNSADGEWLSQRSADNLWGRSRALLRGHLPEPLQWMLGLLVVLYLGHWAWSRVIRPSRVARPRFASPMPLFGRAGESARAAVLAAPTTPRSLTLLELNAGMHSLLLAELELEAHLEMRALFETIAKAGFVDEAQQHEFVWYMALVTKIQQGIAKGRSVRVTAGELNRAHRLVLAIVARVKHRPGLVI